MLQNFPTTLIYLKAIAAMSDMTFYRQRVYRNADPQNILQNEKKSTAAWVSDAEQVAKFRNKTEEKVLTSYCHGMDNTSR